MGETISSLTPQLLVGIAIGALVSIVTLTLLYSGLPVFGPVNDLTNAVVGFMIGLLAWQVFAALPSKSPLSVAGLLFCWAGVALIIGNSVLVAFGRMGWKEGGMYTGIGYGLIGAWLLVTLPFSSLALEFPPALWRSGLAIGVALVFGLAAGPLLAGRLSIKIQPVVWVAYAMTALGWIGLPIWCWMLSQRLW
jgi:hypothetical protein